MKQKKDPDKSISEHIRCERCYGEIIRGKCYCGKHTTVKVTPFPLTIKYKEEFTECQQIQ